MADLRSDWCGGVRITITGAVTAPGGQKLALNDTKDGVLVWYNDGTGEKCMALALSSRRGNYKWLNAQADIAGMINYSHDSFIIRPGMTDAQLNAVGFNDASTAKSNTTNMRTGISDAANVARNTTIGGSACNVPNIQQMKRIYALKDEIDALDPSVKANPTKALSSWSFGSAYSARASTEGVDGAWYCASNGNCYGDNVDKRAQRCVIPILELNPTTLRPL